MSPSALSKIENGDRRVDVDDLTVFAYILQTTPAALLTPPEGSSPPTGVPGGQFNARGDPDVGPGPGQVHHRGPRPLLEGRVLLRRQLHPLLREPHAPVRRGRQAQPDAPRDLRGAPGLIPHTSRCCPRPAPRARPRCPARSLATTRPTGGPDKPSDQRAREASPALPVPARRLDHVVRNPERPAVEVPDLRPQGPRTARARRHPAHPRRLQEPRRGAASTRRGIDEEEVQRTVPVHDPDHRRVRRTLDRRTAAAELHHSGLQEDDPQPRHALPRHPSGSTSSPPPGSRPTTDSWRPPAAATSPGTASRSRPTPSPRSTSCSRPCWTPRSTTG